MHSPASRIWTVRLHRCTSDRHHDESDTAQVKTDIYQSALNSNASTDNTLTVLNNDLKDAKTQARIEGKNAYIRALNNGSSKSAAKNAAKEAVSDVVGSVRTHAYTQKIAHFMYLHVLLSSQQKCCT